LIGQSPMPRERAMQRAIGMMSFLRNLFPSRRRSRFGMFQDRTSALARRVGPRRGGLALLASIAAPFVVNRIRNRRAARAF
jgi:hypothetical protein